jgi:hypothetical protein
MARAPARMRKKHPMPIHDVSARGPGVFGPYENARLLQRKITP